ncbi:MAG: sporulation protein YqfD [Clostridia bacterium]|nr:sporulation protein YqfD [Clostridia bacterium]
MWKLWRGYVILQLEALDTARVLRRMLSAGIPVFCVRKQNETTATVGVYARDVRRLRPIRRRERFRMHILERHGLPFWWMRMRRRPVLLVGLPLCVIALCVALARIWVIRIDGAVRTDPAEVLEQLAAHGLSVGKRPKGAALIYAADDLSAQLTEAARVTIHRDGVILEVSVQEADPQHDRVDWSVPADIVAKKEAVIVSVETKRGQAAVQPGQTVQRGDVLISGHVVYSEDKTAYDTHADGEVLGACVYTADAELPRTVTEWVPSGETVSVRSVYVCGIPLWRRRIPYAQYRETGERTVFVSAFGLPISMRVSTAAELCERERVLTEGERREQAELYAVNDAIALVPTDARICSIHTVEQTEGGTTRVRCQIVTEERIGMTKEYKNE